MDTLLRVIVAFVFLFTSGALQLLAGEIRGGLVTVPPTVDSTPRRLPSVDAAKLIRRMPAEFELQQVLLLGGRDMIDSSPELFCAIVHSVCKHVRVVVLVNDEAELASGEAVLASANLFRTVQFVVVPHDSMWIRDYGPTAIDIGGRRQFVDASYTDSCRPQDDRVPQKLGNLVRETVLHTDLRIEGGNLLTNGEGLCITTTKTIVDNEFSYDQQGITDNLKKYYGATQVVYLEPLLGETTSHVDMFATFIAKDTVVVGSYDPGVDPENAQILNRNAFRLARLRVAGRPLRVVRMPMPSHADGIWRTYTNVVFANGVLLVPIYPDQNRALEHRVLALYRQLLPQWRVIGIDATELVPLGGALHCVTMNIAARRPIVKVKSKNVAAVE